MTPTPPHAEEAEAAALLGSLPELPVVSTELEELMRAFTLEDSSWSKAFGGVCLLSLLLSFLDVLTYLPVASPCSVSPVVPL